MKYIYGLNISGQSIIDYFFTKQILFFAWDDSVLKRKEIKKKYKKIKLVSPKDLDWIKISEVYVSPGINLNIKSLSKSRNYKTPLYRDLELYSQINSNNKIIAVTGTNGKSTTVKLLGEILKSNGLGYYIGGNYGPPLMSVYNNKILFKYHVVELSSYQLESAPSFKSFISILLNISSDHQDRYKSLVDYAKTKEKIFNCKKTKYKIISVDDKFCRKILKKNKQLKNFIPFSINEKIKNGVSIIDQTIYDNYFKKKSYYFSLYNQSLNGKHNNQNILVAYIVCRILGLNFKKFLSTIRNFKGLSHRLETVYENHKCLVINNSKATNVDSSINSIKIYENVFLILGGRIKNKNFSSFNKVRKRVKKCYIIGESTELIFNQVSNYFQSYKCFTLNKAIELILKQLKKFKSKAIILLAPACSSFDQFNDFEDRGNQFKKMIIKKFK
tara:strand:+ start:101 stop:1429 length:1329 start_codon:yes stop_codon:yes gene_type:complete